MEAAINISITLNGIMMQTNAFKLHKSKATGLYESLKKYLYLYTYTCFPNCPSMFFFPYSLWIPVILPTHSIYISVWLLRNHPLILSQYSLDPDYFIHSFYLRRMKSSQTVHLYHPKFSGPFPPIPFNIGSDSTKPFLTKSPFATWPDACL